MPATYKKIQSVTVTASTAAAMEFTSIPTTYTDLLLKISARSTNASNVSPMIVTFNSDTTNANYRYTVLYVAGTTVGSEGNASSRFAIFYQTADSATASTFGNAEVYIPNYAGSKPKLYSVDSVGENNATNSGMGMNNSLWNQTSAVTSISIAFDTGINIKQHSTATLYGILKK